MPKRFIIHTHFFFHIPLFVSWYSGEVNGMSLSGGNLGMTNRKCHLLQRSSSLCYKPLVTYALCTQLLCSIYLGTSVMQLVHS